MNNFLSVEQKQLQINNNNNNSNDRLSTVINDLEKYNRFDISHSYFTSFDSGKLIPFFVEETLPGDIFSIKTSGIIRMSTPASNTMTNPIISINFFYINNSNLLRCWNQIFGDNPNAGYSSETLNLPSLKLKNQPYTFNENDLWSYFGLPIGIQYNVGDTLVNNSLPFFAYAKIWNDWYRDQNLDSEAITFYNWENQDGPIECDSTTNDYHQSTLFGKGLLPTSKLPDYFTTCLPWQQKGQDISIDPLPLDYLSEISYITNQNEENKYFVNPLIYGDNDQILKANTLRTADNGTMGGVANTQTGAWSSAKMALKVNFDTSVVTPQSLYTINDLRNSITIQHFLEISARFGTRYNEYLYSHWGILIDPLDVNKSILFGSWEDSLQLSNVVQTSKTDGGQPLGSLAGYLQNSFSTEKYFTYASKDHGFIFGMLTIRTPIYYSNNYKRMFLRSDKFDYYHPVFKNISDQPVYTLEMQSFNSKDIDQFNESKESYYFGYNEAWAHYRYSINQVTGFLNPNSKQSLASLYLYSQKLERETRININWMLFDSNIISNTLFITDQSTVEFYHQFIANINIECYVDRLLPIFGVPGVNKI